MAMYTTQEMCQGSLFCKTPFELNVLHSSRPVWARAGGGGLSEKTDIYARDQKDITEL
jgi:hypothetical protein